MLTADQIARLHDPQERQKLAIELAMSGRPPPDMGALPGLGPPEQSQLATPVPSPSPMAPPPQPQPNPLSQATNFISPLSRALLPSSGAEAGAAAPTAAPAAASAGGGAGGGATATAGLFNPYSALALAILGGATALQHNNVSSIPHALEGKTGTDILHSPNVQNHLAAAIGNNGASHLTDTLRPVTDAGNPSRWGQLPKDVLQSVTAPYSYLKGLFS